MRLTVESSTTTVTSTLSDEATIDEVLEAVDYALRGIGFDPATVHKGFAAYGGDHG